MPPDGETESHMNVSIAELNVTYSCQSIQLRQRQDLGALCVRLELVSA